MDKVQILIVDDEQGIRLLVREILGHKYGVLEARDGQEAIDMANRHKPDLILMDILMPKVSGYEACSTIKANPATKRIPVVMVTAIDYELNKDLAGSVGADGYLTKPFLEEELLDTISKLLKTPK